MTNKTKQKAYRDRFLKTGGRFVNVAIPASIATAMSEHQKESGESAQKIILDLLRKRYLHSDQ